LCETTTVGAGAGHVGREERLAPVAHLALAIAEVVHHRALSTIGSRTSEAMKGA
jgi:hypothetical protein